MIYWWCGTLVQTRNLLNSCFLMSHNTHSWLYYTSRKSALSQIIWHTKLCSTGQGSRIHKNMRTPSWFHYCAWKTSKYCWLEHHTCRQPVSTQNDRLCGSKVELAMRDGMTAPLIIRFVSQCLKSCRNVANSMMHADTLKLYSFNQKDALLCTKTDPSITL